MPDSILNKLKPYQESLANAVRNPDFENAGRVHDWRNHVCSELKELWPHLSEEARLVIVIQASEAASSEEWE